MSRRFRRSSLLFASFLAGFLSSLGATAHAQSGPRYFLPAPVAPAPNAPLPRYVPAAPGASPTHTMADGLSRPPARGAAQHATKDVRFAGFLSLGASLVNIQRGESDDSAAPVGTQGGVLSLSIELRMLAYGRFGIAITPLSWQPNGGLQEDADHWRLVRFGGGPRVQLLPPEGRAELTLGYDMSYMRYTDVEYCLIDCSHSSIEQSRTFEALAHTVSLRLDTQIGGSAARIGVLVHAGRSGGGQVRWLGLGVSVGMGSRG